MRRRDFLRAGAVAGAAVLAGCTTRYGGDPVSATTGPTATSLSTKPPGQVRLGIAEYRPYAYRGDDGLTGQVVEVAKAVCERTDAELTAVLVPYDRLRLALESGNVDAIGALRLAPRNCAWVTRFVPDHLSNSALAVPAANPLGLRTLDEARAKQVRVAVIANSIDVTFAQEAGVTTIVSEPTAEVALAAVTDGQVDCFLYDDITLHDLLADKPALTVGPSFAPPGGALVYGFGFGKDTDAVADAFADGLADLRDSGEWLRTARPFGFAEANVLTAEDAEKSCG